MREQKLQIKNLHEHLAINSPLRDRVRVLEDFSRSKNPRITSFLERKDETSEQTRFSVQSLIKDNLKVEDVEVKDSYRVGRSAGDGPSKQVIVKLAS